MYGELENAPQVVKQYCNLTLGIPRNSTAAWLAATLKAYGALDSEAIFSESAKLPSFDDIFNSFKNDGELNKLIDEFVRLLNQIIDENDEILTSQIARELRTILEQLSNRDKKSILEVRSWMDLGVKALLLCVETHTGMHGLGLAWEGIKTGSKVAEKISEQYKDSQTQLLNHYRLNFIRRAVEQHPQLPDGETIDEALRLHAPEGEIPSHGGE